MGATLKGCVERINSEIPKSSNLKPIEFIFGETTMNDILEWINESGEELDAYGVEIAIRDLELVY